MSAFLKAVLFIVALTGVPAGYVFYRTMTGSTRGLGLVTGQMAALTAHPVQLPARGYRS